MADCWLGDGREYDVLVNNHGEPGFFKDRGAEHYFEIREYKYRTLRYLYQNHFPLLSQYDYVMCPDPDLKTKIEDVNDLFRFVKRYGLDLAQPSITGFANWPILKPVSDANILIRHANLIEPMCPIFSKDAMLKCLWTFDFGYSAWGLDFVWPILVSNKSKLNVGVINPITVEHTRKCTTTHMTYPNEKTSWDEMSEVMMKFGFVDCKAKVYKITTTRSIDSYSYIME